MIFLATTAMDTQTTVAVCALGLLSVFFGIFALYTLKLDIKGLVDREERRRARDARRAVSPRFPCHAAQQLELVERFARVDERIDRRQSRCQLKGTRDGGRRSGQSHVAREERNIVFHVHSVPRSAALRGAEEFRRQCRVVDEAGLTACHREKVTRKSGSVLPG